MYTTTNYGNQGVLISLNKQSINQENLAIITQLNNALKATAAALIINTIPAYCSLLIICKPEHIKVLTTTVKQLNLSTTDQITPTKTHKIPVCYDKKFGIDLELIAQQNNTSIDEIITTHTNTTYKAYMMGFLPGFPYLGTNPPTLQIPRKKEARTTVPQGAVAIANEQCGIYPCNSPGGWNIIGNTPTTLITNEKLLLQTGDTIQFYPIDLNTYHNLKKRQ